MTRLWEFIGAEVWAPGTAEITGYDCDIDIPDYGPRRTWTLDRTGHALLGLEFVKVIPKGNPLPFARCECGWFDHALNYEQLHLAEVMTDRVWAYA